MSTISITTTPEQDSAVTYATSQFNAGSGNTLTPVQYAKQRIDQLLNGMVQRWKDETRTSKAELYQRASPEDQAAIDAILAKYAG